MSRSPEESKALWKRVESLYPDIDDVLARVTKNIEQAIEAQRELDEKYPVEGFEWDYDPNSIGVDGICPFFLVDAEDQQEMEAEQMARLETQKDCAEGYHQFVLHAPSGVNWCSFCGMIVYPDGKKCYPQFPHFLKKQKEEKP